MSCSTVTTGDVSSGLGALGKSNIDQVIELHQKIVMEDLKQLAVKLYKRNPTMRHDRDKRTIQQSVDKMFAMPYDVTFKVYRGDVKKPDEIINLAFDQKFHGDRVRAFILGLRKMLMASYNNHTEFYYITDIDEQKLYNSARNIEIAAWLLHSKKDSAGKPFLLSDAIADDFSNLSFQRLMGEMIATQDKLAKIMQGKTGRTIKQVVITSATFFFLPI